MNHNDMKRNNGMRDTMSATRKRHGSGGFAIRQQRMILTQGDSPLVRADEITAHSQRHYGSLPTTLRLVVTRSGGFATRQQRVSGFAIRLLLIMVMLTLGLGGAWGQIDEGLYYIKSNANQAYYLCPSIGCYYDNNVDQPHLTTFQTSGDQNSIWEVKFAETVSSISYYYLIHHKTGKYLKSNSGFSIDSGSNRKAVHLEDKPSSLDEYYEFCIKNNSGTYQIYPKKYDSDASSMSFNCRGGNQAYYFPQNGLAMGIVGLYGSGDAGSKWKFTAVSTASKPCATPIIKYDGDNINISYPYSDETGITIYYTTDGSVPSTTSSSNSSTSFNIPANGVVKVRAFATKTGLVNSDEAMLWGSARYVLIQSTEDTNYYLVPSSNESNVNTTSVASEKMQWTLQNAGTSADGVQYYYIVNSNGKKIQYAATLGMNEASADDNKFCIVENGYNTGVYFLIPISLPSKWVYKNKGNIEADDVTAVDIKSDNLVLSQWKIKECNSGADQKSLFDNPPFTLCNDINGTYYYKIVCLGTNGEKDSYIVPSATHAGISKTETDRNKSWMFAKASDDNWQNYYYIVSAATGKYMRFREEALTSSITATLENAVILEDQPIPNDDRYQFLLARAVNDKTSDDTYYIIPKTHKDIFTDNKYYGFWNDDNQVKATLSRTTNARNVKWIFQPNTTDLFCLDPIATQDGDGNVSLECLTIGAEIHYTDNGDTPNSSSSAFDSSTPWTATDKKVIKAIAVLKNHDTVTSDNTITVYNNPDITLDPEYTNYTYDRSAHEPGINSVFIGETNIESTWYKTVTSSNYSNNINAGTAKVTLEDAPDDNIFVFNASKEFTINPVTLPVTADANQSKGYGDPDPVLTYTYDATAIVTGDVVEDIQTGELGRAPGETVGTYAINVGTLAFTNYSISFTGDYFEITKKSLGSGSTPAENITCDITETNGTHSIVVKQGGNDLTLGTDYTKNSETENTKYYNVTVAGTGNYEGGFSVKLAKIKLSKLTGSSSPGGAALFVSNSGDGNFEVPSDMTAYIVTGISGNTLVIEDLDNIPDNVPVLLLSTIDANGFVVQAKASATPPTGTNLLKEVTDDPSKHFNTADIYLLYKGEFVLNMEGDLAKGKIYLPKPSGVSPAPARLGIVWEQDTSIDTTQFSVLSSQLPGTWYTLDGRRLNSQPTKKGLYLWKGKKVVVK